MSPELDLKLVQEHPTVFADRSGDMRSTAMCWGFDCGDGWYGIIKEAADRLEPIFAQCKANDPEGWSFGYYRATQVKEKFGTLRLYLSAASDEAHQIAIDAEKQSETVCEECGKPGELRGRGWYYTACDAHLRS
jgi:hypothetical protein